MEKEKLTETYEIMNERLRQERDTHKNHLMSLETTFSDLHTYVEALLIKSFVMFFVFLQEIRAKQRIYGEVAREVRCFK